MIMIFVASVPDPQLASSWLALIKDLFVLGRGLCRVTWGDAEGRVGAEQSFKVEEQIRRGQQAEIGYNNYLQEMDQYAKLRKMMQNRNPKQFAKRLAHALRAVKSTILNELIFDVILLDSEHIPDYLTVLLECGLDINFVSKVKSKESESFGKTALMMACKTQDYEKVSCLLECRELRLDIQDQNGENALFYALANQTEENSYRIISAILAKTPDFARSRNRQGNSLLLLALKRDSYRIVELLLKNSADPNSRCSQQGNTALIETMVKFSDFPEKMKDITMLLLNYKADPYIPNFKKESAFDLARRQNFDLKRLVDLFKIGDEEFEEPYTCENELNSVTKDENSEHSEADEESTEEEPIPFSSHLLSGEMLALSKEREKVIVEAWSDIERIYKELQKIGDSFRLRIDIIGSYAFGLWTPISDIDIVFTNVETAAMSGEKSLSLIYQELRRKKNQLGIRQIFLNNGLSFPNIKIELSEKLHSRKLDITIFQKRNNGLKYVNYIVEGISRYPAIKPVYFTMHRILESFNLHNPAKGGLKTYALYLMILNVVKYFEASDLGQMLINVIYYYAYCFDYEQRVGPDGELIVKLNITDPLNESNNLGGRKTEIEKLRCMFRVVDYGLRMADGRDILGYLLSLHNSFKE